jgi:hypothetical protein
MRVLFEEGSYMRKYGAYIFVGMWYPDTWISGYLDIRILGYPDTWISGYLDIQAFLAIHYPNTKKFKISKYPSIQLSMIFKYPCIQVSGYIKK